MEKANLSEIERVATHDRVPGHSNYYEKNGLRTCGDDEDHDHEPKVCLILEKKEHQNTDDV